jgi:hypothetical protein
MSLYRSISLNHYSHKKIHSQELGKLSKRSQKVALAFLFQKKKYLSILLHSQLQEHAMGKDDSHVGEKEGISCSLRLGTQYQAHHGSPILGTVP